MPNLKDFMEALQAGWFPAFAALIGCSIVVAGDWYSIPYLSNAPEWLTTTAAYVGVFALSVLLANIAYFPVRIWQSIKRKQARAEFSDAIQKEIANAPPQEIAILAYLVTSGRKAFAAEFNERRLAPLVSKGIIVKLGGTHSILEWPYMVQDAAWNCLLENKDHLIVPNIEGIGDPFHWRGSSW